MVRQSRTSTCDSERVVAGEIGAAGAAEAEVADEKDPDKQAGMCPSDKDHMAVVDRT